MRGTHQGGKCCQRTHPGSGSFHKITRRGNCQSCLSGLSRRKAERGGFVEGKDSKNFEGESDGARRRRGVLPTSRLVAGQGAVSLPARRRQHVHTRFTGSMSTVNARSSGKVSSSTECLISIAQLPQYASGQEFLDLAVPGHGLALPGSRVLIPVVFAAVPDEHTTHGVNF